MARTQLGEKSSVRRWSTLVWDALVKRTRPASSSHDIDAGADAGALAVDGLSGKRERVTTRALWDVEAQRVTAGTDRPAEAGRSRALARDPRAHAGAGGESVTDAELPARPAPQPPGGKAHSEPIAGDRRCGRATLRYVASLR